MAKYEIMGRPPDFPAPEAVRRDFADLLRELESSPGRVIVVFGIAWEREIYEEDWLPFELTGKELRERVEAAEAGGIGSIGSDDLFITMPETGVELQYCHEGDIHVTASEKTHPYLQARREAWIRAGWQVDEAARNA